MVRNGTKPGMKFQNKENQLLKRQCFTKFIQSIIMRTKKRKTLYIYHDVSDYILMMITREDFLWLYL